MGEAWIQNSGRGTQTEPSLVLMTMAKKESKVTAYVSKGTEEEIEVVKEEDNYIILQEKNKNKLVGVDANGR